MKTKTIVITFILLAVLMTACAAAATPVIEEVMVEMEAAAEVVADQPAPQQEAPPPENGPSEEAPNPDDPGSTDQLAFAPVGKKMVIKDAELEVLVQNTDVAIAQVNQLTADYDGYIISTQSWYVDGFKHATVRLGIPSQAFETVVNQLRDLGLRVISETAAGQDVSNEYVDLQSKLTNLEATADRIRVFLSEAETIDETLTISAKLSELEAQIEQVKGQMRYYEGRSAYSTITVNLVPQYPTPTPTMTPTPTATPVPTLTPTPVPGWNAQDTFEDASEVIVNVTQDTVDILIWFFVVLAPIGIFIGLIIWAVRRGMRAINTKYDPPTPKDE